ncbi:PIR protein [Plasmodium ovale]|uniref:PIR Superfamily Protein n=2 Tax=Plasmodium ovale TaxID=36330 RepID=A0A1A8WPL8_PLAOA|nr:PIR Superfamily Protein [Plasmodium ovale curtisi]SBT83155.1 PIR protein [Plasmodium ovale]
MGRWEELFKNAPVNKIYEEFNQVSDVLGYDTHFKEALQKANDDIKIKEISAKLVGNLLNNSKLNRYSSNNREYCTHLRFWLYEQIITKFSHNADKKILDIINELFGGWHSFNSIRSKVYCSPVYMNDSTLEEWKRGKLLHDYFKNYEYITQNYTYGNEKCEEYRTYLQYIKEQYEAYKQKCSSDWMAPCNHYYRHIDEYNPNVLLSKPSCEDKNVHRVSSTEYTGEIREAIEMPPAQETLEMENVQDHNAPSVSFYNVVVASSSILGTFIFFFIFYRLTPLGHMLRTRLLRKKLIDHNIYNEESNEYLENAYDQENRLYNTSGHTVGYNPLNIP